MIAPDAFVQRLSEGGVSFFTGVPDSLLKNLGSYIAAALPPEQHVIAANEGAAVGIGIGHYLRTGHIPVIYLQNSGVGNTVNPLLSLADADVYGIPMLLVVGWRGQPGVKDEPQHVKQGRVMPDLFDAMEIPYFVLPREEDEALVVVDEAMKAVSAASAPVAIFVEADTFAVPEIGVQPTALADGLPSREDALIALAQAVGNEAVIVSTTGMLSRELFEFREAEPRDVSLDFLTVGGMGHAAAIAQGVALADPGTDVWAFDGDGALLMHAGTLAVTAKLGLKNFFHVLFNNGVHDSVGGQPTAISVVDLPALARAFGYVGATRLGSLAEAADAVAAARSVGGPYLIEIQVRPGNRKGIGRPTRTPKQSKDAFIDSIRGRG